MFMSFVLVLLCCESILFSMHMYSSVLLFHISCLFIMCCVSFYLSACDMTFTLLIHVSSSFCLIIQDIIFLLALGLFLALIQDVGNLELLCLQILRVL